MMIHHLHWCRYVSRNLTKIAAQQLLLLTLIYLTLLLHSGSEPARRDELIRYLPIDYVDETAQIVQELAAVTQFLRQLVSVRGCAPLEICRCHHGCDH